MLLLLLLLSAILTLVLACTVVRGGKMLIMEHVEMDMESNSVF